MKSLQESLFDKDLAEKELTLRNAYDILGDYKGFKSWGMPIGQIFSVNMVNHYKNPYSSDERNDFFRGLFGIIMDMPVPSDKDINSGGGDWAQKLISKQGLGKYVSPSWRHEYNEKFEAHLRKAGKNLIEVIIQCGDAGGYVIALKRKGSK